MEELSCRTCGKIAKGKAGLAAHERHCKGVEAEATEVPKSAPVSRETTHIVMEKGGYKITFDGMYHIEDKMGRVIGHFVEQMEAELNLRGLLRFSR